MPERQILADNIIKFRKKYNLSQFEMAAECGVSTEVLSLIERQRENITLNTLQKFAAFMGKSVSEILSYKEKDRILTMDITYQVTKQNLNDEETGSYMAYGISAISVKDDEIIVFDTISDIFMNYGEAKKFAELCNKYKLSTLHFHDAVQDIIIKNNTL